MGRPYCLSLVTSTEEVPALHPTGETERRPRRCTAGREGGGAGRAGGRGGREGLYLAKHGGDDGGGGGGEDNIFGEGEVKRRRKQ